MTSRPPRIGVVGFGRIVENVYLPLLLELGADLAAVADISPARREAFLGLCPDGRAYEDAADLHGAELDGVIIAAPNVLHAQLSIESCKAGLAVLCEKPLALEPADLDAMRAAAKAANRPLLAGYPSGSRPDVSSLASHCQAGSLGDLQLIRASWVRAAGVPTGWFTRRAEAGGGALVDLGSHLLQAVLSLADLGRPTDMLCTLRYPEGRERSYARWYGGEPADTGDCDVEIAAEAMIRFEHGATLFLDVSWDAAAPTDRTVIQVRGDRGEAKLSTLFGFSPAGDRPQYPLKIHDASRRQLVFERFTPDPFAGHRAVVKSFLAALAGGFQSSPELEAALAASRLIHDLYGRAR